MNIKYTCALVIVSSVVASHAQVQDIHPFKHPSGNGSQPFTPVSLSIPKPLVQELGQAGVVFNNAEPKIRIEALKFYLGLSDNSAVPFYIYSTYPLKSDNDTKSTEDSVLDNKGGVLNASIAWDGKTSLLDFKSPNEGFFIEASAAAKVVDGAPTNSNTSQYVLVGQASISPHVILPIFGETIDESNKVGALTIGASLSGKLLGAQDTKDIFGPDADKAFAHADVFGTLYITDVIFVSGGGTLFSTDTEINDRWYFQVSYAKAIP